MASNSSLITFQPSRAFCSHPAIQPPRQRAPRCKVLASSSAVTETVQSSSPDFPDCTVVTHEDKASRKSVVVFLSGFAQSPESYGTVLDKCAEEGVTVLAPQTVTIAFNRCELQNRIIGDAVHWVKELAGSNEDLIPYLPEEVPTSIGLLGHSLGGGCSFAVAKHVNDNSPGGLMVGSIAGMAPFPSLVGDSSPSEVIPNLPGIQNTLVYAGKLDLLALAFRIKENIVDVLKDEQKSCQYNLLDLGFHTIYVTQLRIPLDYVWKALTGKVKGERSPQAILGTVARELPGLLAGSLENPTVIGIVVVLLVGIAWIAGLGDIGWLRDGALVALVIAIADSVVLNTIRFVTKQPQTTAEQVADFFS